MVIGFKERFIEKINDGTKIHTIRVDKHDRWKTGMKMHMSTGVRTKKYHQFDERICTGTQKISIQYYEEINSMFIKIDGKFFGSIFFANKNAYYTPEILELIKNDGFDDVGEFVEWFNKDFQGKIIHWTDKRY